MRHWVWKSSALVKNQKQLVPYLPSNSWYLWTLWYPQKLKLSLERELCSIPMYVVHQRKMFSCHFDKNLSMSCYTIRSLQKLAVIFSGRINHRLLEPNRNTSNVAKHHHLSLVTWFSFVKNEGKRILFILKYLLKL